MSDWDFCINNCDGNTKMDSNKKTMFCLTLLLISTLLGERQSSMFMFHLSHRSDTGDPPDPVKITK